MEFVRSDLDGIKFAIKKTRADRLRTVIIGASTQLILRLYIAAYFFNPLRRFLLGWKYYFMEADSTVVMYTEVLNEAHYELVKRRGLFRRRSKRGLVWETKPVPSIFEKKKYIHWLL